MFLRSDACCALTLPAQYDQGALLMQFFLGTVGVQPFVSAYAYVFGGDFVISNAWTRPMIQYYGRPWHVFVQFCFAGLVWSLSRTSFAGAGVPVVPVGVLIPLSQEHLRRSRAGPTGRREGIRLHRTPKGAWA